jgi:hypothetical protein
MSIRPLRDTLEALRATLQNLEKGLDPTQDATVAAELKRAVLLRIAELELLDAACSESACEG